MERIRTNDRSVLGKGTRFPLRNEEVRNIEYVGNCVDPGIARIAETNGVRFSYDRAKKLIKRFYPSMYNELALDFYNPWCHKTKKIWYKDRYYLVIVHSMTEYVFEIIV